MIKQRKLKHKKNFDKRFHRNIHEFAVSRPQKKKKRKRNMKQQFIILQNASFRKIKMKKMLFHMKYTTYA